MIRCENENCRRWFDPLVSRWLCPWCKHKHHCCD